MPPDEIDLEDDLPLDPPADEVVDLEADGDEPVEPIEAADEVPGDEPRDPPEQIRQPSRAQRRIETLRTEISARDQRMADLERRLNEALAQRAAPRQESAEERGQRLALLTPEERMTETLREAEVRHTHQLQAVSFQLQDGQDKATFDAKGLVDPLFAKWGPKVEAELAGLRTKGQNVAREALMYYLIGQNAVANRKAAGAQQRRDATRRLDAARTRPSAARSDTPSTRRQSDTLERRLENLPL